jgi:ribosomal protein RSM22 (predicted rRNA methylase)
MPHDHKKKKIAELHKKAAIEKSAKLNIYRLAVESIKTYLKVIENAKQIVTELKDEMQNWYDSIPENLQSGTKADEVQEAIDALESLEGELESLDFNSVNFPGMF